MSERKAPERVPREEAGPGSAGWPGRVKPRNSPVCVCVGGVQQFCRGLSCWAEGVRRRVGVPGEEAGVADGSLRGQGEFGCFSCDRESQKDFDLLHFKTFYHTFLKL